jgi:hypothetical protein
MAWWSRKKARVRPERVHEDLDVVLDPYGIEAFAPPQVETLFDADEYVQEFAARAPEPEAGSDAEAEPEPGPEPAEEAAEVAAPEPELAPEPEAEPTPDPEPDPEPSSSVGPDDDGLLSEPESAHDDLERPAPASHARRRAHGRSWRSRAVRARAEVSAAPAEPDDASVAVEPKPGAPRPGRFSRARAVVPAVGKRAIAVGLIIVVLLGAVAALPLFADGINWLVRWNKLRTAASTTVAVPAQDNLLVIGVSDGVVVGFAALKAERPTNKILGIAIPDGAFVEVPGQGFERVGASYLGGPQVSEDAISNFFGVPFRKYVVVDGTSYQALLRNQDVTGLMQSVTSTDLTADEKASFTSYFATVNTKDVWIVPLPVKPVAVGDQRYFEPQKKEIADLLLQWWGVEPSQTQSTPRVIVYNGVGTPGLAGVAAQQLIRAGFRIVNSGNAANFDYKTTEIHLFHGTQADADAVRASLGVGRVIIESAPQELTDMIVIIGSDYRPPTSDISTVPTEGVQ